MNKDDAYAILDELDAPAHLKNHVDLVGEAAEALLKAMDALQVDINSEFVSAGVVIHDIGKIVHTEEMVGPGSEHETTGQEILLNRGVSAEYARVCISHARWETMECTLEELTIALSDKLWKGKRESTLELRVIDRVAEDLGKDRWDIYPDLDSAFENISSAGHERLQRSK